MTRSQGRGRWLARREGGCRDCRIVPLRKHTHLLVGAHVFHEHIVAVFLNAEAAEEGGGIAFRVPAFKLGEFLLKLGGLYAVFIREFRFCVDGILFLHDVP